MASPLAPTARIRGASAAAPMRRGLHLSLALANRAGGRRGGRDVAKAALSSSNPMKAGWLSAPVGLCLLPRHSVGRRPVTRCDSVAGSAPGARSAEVEAVVASVREALGLGDGGESLGDLEASGHGRALGRDMSWSIRSAADGSFVEEVVFADGGASIGSGFEAAAGGGAGVAWELSMEGLPMELQLDDRDAMLLMTWVRTGQWVLPSVLGRLDIRIAATENKASDDATAKRAAAVVAAAAATPPPGGKAYGSKKKGPKKKKNKPAGGGQESSTNAIPVVPTRGFGSKAAPPKVERRVLEVRLRGSQVAALVTVDDKGVPGEMVVRVMGGDEILSLDGLSPSEGGSMLLPKEVVHMCDTGSANTFTMDSAKEQTRNAAAYSCPPAPCPPPDTAFAAGLPPEVTVWAAEGTALVRPLVDGRDLGYFILDTGASGMIITPEAAAQLDTEPAGSITAVGSKGPVQCRMLRAGGMSLGPMVRKGPVFTETSVPAPDGAPEDAPVVGLIGGDLFWRAVVEMRNLGGGGFEPTGDEGGEGEGEEGEPYLALHDPSTFGEGGGAAPWLEGAKWEPLELIRQVPHVWAKFSGCGGGAAQLLMLDMGFYGVPCMFHQRAEDLGMVTDIPSTEVLTSFSGAGDGAEQQQQRARVGELEYLELETTGVRFEGLPALYSVDGVCEVSQHACGVLGNIFGGRTVVFDYSRRRMAVLDD